MTYVVHSGCKSRKQFQLCCCFTYPFELLCRGMDKRDMDNKILPIGYYFKKADDLLTEGIDRIQSEFGLTRTDWQVLNRVYEEPGIEKQSLAEAMEPFVQGYSLENRIVSLKTKELISGENNLSLTKNGLRLYKACLQKQTEFRAKTMKGISEKEYLQLIMTLEKLIGNLEQMPH